MLVPNRFESVEGYRYGFQGQEKDDEIKGEGNSLNYTFRMHDPRAGRFFAVDPLTKKYPHYTPYSFSGNKVISSVELEGLEDYFYTLKWDENTGESALTLVKEVPDIIPSFMSSLYINSHYVGDYLTPEKAKEAANHYAENYTKAQWEAKVQLDEQKKEEFNAQRFDYEEEWQYVLGAKYASKTKTNSKVKTLGSIDGNKVSKQLIKNKLPISKDGKLLGSIQNGNVVMKGKTKPNGEFDFIVTEKGDVLLGRKHSFMSGGADVQAAGTLKLRDGKVVNVDNNSGHYQPNALETSQFKEILSKNGVDVSKAHFKTYDSNGKVINHETPKN
jgi:RHS repeat-associated protein